jgi:hypothetical protein
MLRVAAPMGIGLRMRAAGGANRSCGETDS